MELKKYLESFAASDEGKWMRAFPWQNVKTASFGLKLEGVATAMYCVLSNTVKVAPDSEDSVFFSIVAHELYHAYQRHTMGLLRYLLCKTFRRAELERNANDAEIDAAVWFCEQRVKDWRQQKEAGEK